MSQQIWRNVTAALVVSFVALSLGASLGILAGRGAFAGMVSAGLIAAVTSLFGGTRVQCSGPTAPMSAVAAVVVAYAFEQLQRGAPGVRPDHFINLVFLMAAGFLVIAAVLRLGGLIRWVPNVVVSGFMSGIALLIWSDQFARLFGWGGRAPLAGSLAVNVAVAAVTLWLLFTLSGLLGRTAPRLAAYLPATLLAIVLVSGGVELLGLDAGRIDLGGSIRSLDDVRALLVSQWPTQITAALVWVALPFALQLTLLAYLDTLLTSLVIDRMTREATRQNRELAAQGLANGVAALFGGIPGAQATIRSVLIIKEGATLRLAGVLVGVFALIEMLLFQDVIARIPQAVFVGVLIKVGYDVFDWLPLRLYLRQWRSGTGFDPSRSPPCRETGIVVSHQEMLLVVATMTLTVGYDLNAAVIACTALFHLIKRAAPAGVPMPDLQPGTETQLLRRED